MITIGRTWELWAVRREGGALWYVGARRWVELHGVTPVVPVRVDEVVGDDFAPEVTHYGWEHADLARAHPSMIQVRTGADPRRAMMFLDMCFTYGLRAALEHGDGRVVALRVTERALEGGGS